ncbi:FHA domain-containing protein [Nonomuraea endophytica]|uniref:FHA domain-containing protein n=1 Tax=Nonomuraea endophytica TaxID=714136 RepID=A0A7W8EEM6_9ACTN|nr:FHA domain-containing protein [Nonomuraea endophytica]MBB5076734.1 hypothetical protein [Nonomuraea endophytica]
MHFPDSLARGVAPVRPGTLHARTVTGGVKAAPQAGAVVRFGRAGKPEVDLGVGEDDLHVSRQHGELAYRERQWWLRNTGQQLVRLPRGQFLHATTDPIPLATGYTPLFVKGCGHREHLVELYVSGHDDDGLTPHRRAETLPPKIWPLDDVERLLLVILGQRYLYYEENPRPLTYRQAADSLADIRRDERWGERKIEARVETVRRRLDACGFPFPLIHDMAMGRPCDNNLLHNLLRGLVDSTTLVPTDLELLEDDHHA